MSYRIDGEHQASIGTVLDHGTGKYQIAMWVYIYEDYYQSVPFWAKVKANFNLSSSQCSNYNAIWEVLWWTLIETYNSSSYYAAQTMHYNSSTTNLMLDEISTRTLFDHGRLSGWHYISFYINLDEQNGLISAQNTSGNFRFYSYEGSNDTSVRAIKIFSLKIQNFHSVIKERLHEFNPIFAWMIFKSL